MQKFTETQINKEKISSWLLFIGIIAALIISNTPALLVHYKNFINYKFTLGVDGLYIHKTTLKFVNDGLMAIFFLFLGLEMKYHLVLGEFKEKKHYYYQF